MPKITVLVAIKNSAAFLPGCLESLASQTILNQTEIIIVSYRATKKELAIISEFKRRLPIKHIRARKSGLYHAWNLGIKNSKSKYISNLNCDDRLKPNALEIMAKALDENSHIALVYGDSYVTTVPYETFAHNSSGKRRLNWPPYSHIALLLSCICGPHPMWKRHLHQELGLFDESYKIAGDYDFWLRIADKHALMRIPKVFGLYYLNPKGLTFASKSRLQKERFRIKRKYFYSRR